MTKRQRIRYDMGAAIRKNPVGAARTAELLLIRQKYSPGRLSTEQMDQYALFHPNCAISV